MEVVFQNKIEDYLAFGEYFVKETKQGKVLSMQAFRYRQVLIVMFTALLGALYWGATAKWQSGLSVFIIGLFLMETLILIRAKFKPVYYEGIQRFEQQIKSMNQQDLELLQLPRTLKIDDNWLEIRSSEVEHRWRWNAVDQIGLTPNFIFVFYQSVIYIMIPKRDFSSEQGFVDFGKAIMTPLQKG